jgi:hypothetical protein
VEQAGDQIRGWKSIAAAINTSPRTARRWARRRQLPVRQISGSRKSVFILPDELEEWQKAQKCEAGESSDAAPSGRAANPGVDQTKAPGAASRAKTRRRDLATAVHAMGPKARVAAIGGVLVLLLVAATWLARPRPTGTGRTAGAVVIRTIDLRLARPDGWQSVLTVADGGAGQFGGLPGQPAVVLRPRLVEAGLMLEIARVDGRPMVDRPGPPTPFVLLLEPRVVVAVQRPFPFDVEWAGGSASAISTAINR